MPSMPALPTWAWMAAILVGIVFVASSLLKALDPIYFIQYIFDLSLLPRSFIVKSAWTVIAIEMFLGLALILGYQPRWVVPAAFLVLASLAAMGYHGVRQQRVQGCGCYNGFISLSPKESLAVTAGLLTLLLISYWGLRGESYNDPQSQSWLDVGRGTGAVLGTLGCVTLANISYWSYKKRHRLLVDLSPLRPGRSWQESWLPGVKDFSTTKGRYLVAFLSGGCSTCQLWANVLNFLNRLSGLPSVVAVVGVGTEGEGEEVLRRLAAGFPAVIVDRRRLASLVRAELPVLLLLQDGQIQGKWRQRIPDFLLDEAKQQAMRRAVSATGLTVTSYPLAAKGHLGVE